MARHRHLVSTDSLFAATAGELSSEPLFLESVEPVGAKQFTALLTKHIALDRGPITVKKRRTPGSSPPGSSSDCIKDSRWSAEGKRCFLGAPSLFHSHNQHLHRNDLAEIREKMTNTPELETDRR